MHDLPPSSSFGNPFDALTMVQYFAAKGTMRYVFWISADSTSKPVFKAAIRKNVWTKSLLHCTLLYICSFANSGTSCLSAHSLLVFLAGAPTSFTSKVKWVVILIWVSLGSISLGLNLKAFPFLSQYHQQPTRKCSLFSYLWLELQQLNETIQHHHTCVSTSNPSCCVAFNILSLLQVAC